jgi:hypothetical protein
LVVGLGQHILEGILHLLEPKRIHIPLDSKRNSLTLLCTLCQLDRLATPAQHLVLLSMCNNQRTHMCKASCTGQLLASVLALVACRH